jgi:hypothetical protein
MKMKKKEWFYNNSFLKLGIWKLLQIYHFDEIFLILPRIVDRYQRGNQNSKDKH